MRRCFKQVQKIMENNNTVCKLYPEDDAKCWTLKYVTVVSSIVSIVGASLALAVIVYFRLFKDFTQRMVINLCVASMLLGASMLMSQFEDDVTTLCVFQGAAITFSVWACLLWTMCILTNIYTRVIFEYKWTNREVIASLFCWVLSAVMASLPFIGNDVYAPTEIWCWIKNDTGWRFGIWYTWHILSVFIFAIIMVHVVWVLYKKQDEHTVQDPHQIEALKQDIQTLRRYPIVYTVFSIMAIICRITNILQGLSFPMLILFSLTAPLLGSGVAIAFVIDRTTLGLFNKEAIRKAFQKWTRKEELQIKAYNVDNVNKAYVSEDNPDNDDQSTSGNV
ncbi:hypothetical protein ACF0H5_013842 [Mactra antiquata]